MKRFRPILIGAICFLLGAAGIVFGQATGLRPDQFISLPWTWSGAQTFGQVYGTRTSQSGTTYTFAATDCGTEVTFTSNSAVTATVPAAIAPAQGVICNIAVLQFGSAKVAVNGASVTPATLLSSSGYIGTSGIAGSIIIISVQNIGGTPMAILTGNGS